jgi:hypothetical protein
MNDDIRQTVLDALRHARFSAEYAEAIHDSAGNFVSLGDMAKVARIDAAIAYIEAQPAAAPVPDWSKAPDWADFHVYNCMGMGLWSEICLAVNAGSQSGWRGVLLSTNAVFSGYQLPVGIDWRTTLTQRPPRGDA